MTDAPTNRVRRIATNQAVLHVAAFVAAVLVTHAVVAFRPPVLYAAASLFYDSALVQTVPPQLEDFLTMAILTVVLYATAVGAALLRR